MTENGSSLIKSEGFKDVNNAIDYTYDVNGNMTKDLNKGITNISYNHLNLPTRVTIGGKNIDYTYDAGGVKLSKTVSGVARQYAGNYVYENGVLQFFNHPERYVSPKNASDISQGFKYVYRYKDHLGNARLSYTDQDKDGVIRGATSQVFYDDLSKSLGWDSEDSLYGGSATIDDTRSISGNFSAKLEVSGSGGVSKYAHSNQWIEINNSEPTDYIFSGWIYLSANNSAYGRIIFYMNEEGEEDYFTLISSGEKIREQDKWVYIEERVTVPADIDKLNLRIGVYTEGTHVSGWFDDLEIRKVNNTNEIIEESNYYPFGLEHKGYNNVVNGTENNHHTYLGKEISKELGLNWLSFRHRNYMPEIGRFFGVDPVAGDYVTISPYQFAHNNPIWKIELEGLEGQELNGFDVVNAPPSGQSGKNPAAHLPLPIGDRSSGSSSGNKTTRQLVAIQKNQMVTGYPGQALDEAVTAGIQWVGGKLSGSNVSKSTSENIQLGTNLLILITSKGKNLKAGGEALEQLTKTASTKSLAKISLNTSKLSGTGGDVLDAVIKKTNNIGRHLSPSDLKGAVKDILGSPVTINGKAFDHLGEVTDALKGLGKQISKLNKSIGAGTFSDEVLDAAKSLRTQLQNQKDQIQNVLNNAREAGGF
ncbi:RHS repeat-associated core domain-containing protein [Tenacibaculum maritimum]|uniref:RHS repeat-associated core domain-containing protein n=1 Tax=Tenacibaculum maritimum TaxID=107401 RepID=UPI001330FE55|nr:RHS repeat-associated core domain-containing protein [Tenacibaculum maritimum]